MAKIGIRLADGEFYPILDEDSTSRKALIVTTVKDNQPSVQIDVYRAEDSAPAAAPAGDNTYVGSLVVENIAPQPKGIPDIRMELGLDDDGNLTAYARDEVSGEHQTLTVSLKALDQEEIYDIPDFDLTEDTIDSDDAFNPDEFPDTNAFDSEITEIDTELDSGVELGQDFGADSGSAGADESFSMDFPEEPKDMLSIDNDVLSFEDLNPPEELVKPDLQEEKNTSTTIRRETRTVHQKTEKTVRAAKEPKAGNFGDDDKKGMPLWLKILIAAGILLLIAGLVFLVFKLTSDKVPVPPTPAMVETPKAVQPAVTPPPAPAPAPVAAVAPPPVETPAPAPAPVKKAKPTPAPRKPGVWYKIKWGDTLWDLSIAYYRTPWKYGKIYRANKIIKHPDRIISTTWIYIPK